jgi:hypothetical protein
MTRSLSAPTIVTQPVRTEFEVLDLVHNLHFVKGNESQGEAMTPIKWKLICCPSDFSDSSSTAIETGVQLANQFSARLVIFHAHEVPGLTFPTGEVLVTQPIVDRYEKEVDAALLKFKHRAIDLGCEMLIYWF